MIGFGNTVNSSLGPVGDFTTAGLGSGGGYAGSEIGGAGGGLIIISATSFVMTNGCVLLFYLMFVFSSFYFYILIFYIFSWLSADGQPGQLYSGGGSGGSIIINSRFMNGSGYITAVHILSFFFLFFSSFILF